MKSRRSRRLAWNLVMLGVAALFAFEFLRQLHMQTLLPFRQCISRVNVEHAVERKITLNRIWVVRRASVVCGVRLLFCSELSSRPHGGAADEQ